MNFEVHSTTYSKRINYEGARIVFNDDGKSDMGQLKLISKVRSDAANFLKRGDNLRSTYIHFFDLFERPKTDEVIHKVDIKSAYWTYALKRGILSPETNRYFLDKFRYLSYKEGKQKRLRALGSLATTKTILKYTNGVPDWDGIERKTSETKDLYMEICRGVDDLMRECVKNVEGCIYYYWDCIFVSSKFSQDAVDFFKSVDYDVKVGETKLDYVDLGEKSYLISTSAGEKNKIYMVKKENKHLLT